jgi:hypothetical protein
VFDVRMYVCFYRYFKDGLPVFPPWAPVFRTRQNINLTVPGRNRPRIPMSDIDGVSVELNIAPGL